MKQEDIEKDNPYILTAVDGRPIFMHKQNPYYEAKKKDSVVSLDCVLANQDRLIEITEELGLPPELGVFELQA